MEVSNVIGYLLAIIVGITLGLIGSGGSILSMPILVYVFKIEPLIATAYSLFIVGSTALIGGIQKAKEQLVDFKKVIVFGIPTLVSVFMTRLLIVPMIPKTIIISDFFILKSDLIMIVFTIVMIMAAYKMINSKVISSDLENENYFKIITTGIGIGLLAGFIGAGGGFLIVPSLIFLMKTPIKKAIGTSLFIIAIQSLVGFSADLNTTNLINWKLLISFTLLAIIGIFIGNAISKKVDGNILKKGFGWVVLLIGFSILIELFSDYFIN